MRKYYLHRLQNLPSIPGLERCCSQSHRHVMIQNLHIGHWHLNSLEFVSTLLFPNTRTIKICTQASVATRASDSQLLDLSLELMVKMTLFLLSSRLHCQVCPLWHFLWCAKWAGKRYRSPEPLNPLVLLVPVANLTPRLVGRDTGGIDITKMDLCL